MGIKIRKAELRDIDRLCELLSDLFSIETCFHINTERQKAGLMLLLEDPDRKVIYVAESEDTIIGMVTAQIVISTAAGGYSILLEDVYVIDDFRRKGVASALIKKVISWGSEKGVLRIQLVADKKNPAALVFYKRLGFHQSRMIGFYL